MWVLLLHYHELVEKVGKADEIDTLACCLLWAVG